MNKPASRFVRHLKAFEQRLLNSVTEPNKDNAKRMGQLLHANDGRTPMFQLQGLARIECKVGREKKKAEKWLTHFKSIEDALGKYDYWHAMIEWNKSWRFPKELSHHFEKQAYFSLGVLEERLLQLGWIQKGTEGIGYSNDAMESLSGEIGDAEFYGTEKEKRRLLELFRDEASEIHEKVKHNVIDLGQIEEGVHELRRKIRWLGIYSSALLGKVRMAKMKKNQPLSHFVTEEKAKYKFNQLPVKNDQKDPVFFISGGFYAMSDLIREIGDIKDPGLATLEMLQLGRQMGYDEPFIRRHLADWFYPKEKVIDDARLLVDRFLFKEELLLHIADHFDKQLR